MKKYNKLTIYDDQGYKVFDGSYSRLLEKFNNRDDANDYVEECKEKGWECTCRTCYYDFEYDNPNTVLSDNWLDDICAYIYSDGTDEFIEAVVLKSFSALKKTRVQFIGDYVCVVLPKQYDSVIVRSDGEIGKKFFTKLLRTIYENINSKHNKTTQPKIRVAEFVPDWRSKIIYADYNEGYTFYYNSIPNKEKINALLK